MTAGPVERDDLARAEAVLTDYSDASLISDEAELLRGCLYALVSIARELEVKPGH